MWYDIWYVIVDMWANMHLCVACNCAILSNGSTMSCRFVCVWPSNCLTLDQRAACFANYVITAVVLYWMLHHITVLCSVDIINHASCQVMICTFADVQEDRMMKRPLLPSASITSTLVTMESALTREDNVITGEIVAMDPTSMTVVCPTVDIFT